MTPIRFVPQLDGSLHQSSNCTFVSVAHALHFATGNDVSPGPEQLRRAASPVSGPGDAANTLDAKQAFDAYLPKAQAKGWKVRPAIRHASATWDGVVAALDEGYGVGLAIDYGTVNERRPSVSGDPLYRGPHAVFLGRIRRKGSRVHIKVWDGLCDGRRPGIPRGPQWYPAWLLQMAASDFAGDEAATYVIYRPGHRAEPPQTPVEPETITLTRDLYDAILARSDALEQALGVARTALIANSDEAIAAIDDIDELLPPLTSDPGAVVFRGQGEEDTP